MIRVDGLLLDLNGPTATVTFNRPDKANYIDNNWIAPLKSFFEEVKTRSDIRCVLIKANGKHFMAGGDLNFHDELMTMTHNERFGKLVSVIDEWNEMLFALLALPQPVVASVQGGAVGASFGLVAACDLVVAAENAFFSIAHVLHGGSIDGLVTYILPRQIGYKKTMHLALLGQRLSAREAERLGLVSSVVPLEDLRAETDKIVEHLANGPSVAYKMIKDLVSKSLDRSIEEQAQLENIYCSRSTQTEDWVEGSDAVFRKRPAKFVGR